jgi:hypothetical protein
VSDRIRDFGIRFGIIYGALLALMVPPVLGPAHSILAAPVQLLSRPFVELLGLGPYPIPADVLFRIIVSALGAWIWLTRERKPRDTRTLFQLLIVELRFVVGAALIWVGLGHALGVLAPLPSQADWIRPIREMEPVHYLNVWMGTSVIHKIGQGMAELTAGACLIIPQTVRLGGFLALGILGNDAITLIAFGNPRLGRYLIPMEMAGMAFVVLLPELRRFVIALSRDNESLPPLQRPSWPPEWAKLAPIAYRAAVAAIVLLNLPTAIRAYDATHKSPNAGVYEVERFVLNGRDTLTGSEAQNAWTTVAIDQCQRFAARTVSGLQYEGAITLPDANWANRQAECVKATSGAKGVFTLARPDVMPPVTAEPALVGELRYTRSESGNLNVEGKIGNATIVAELRRVPDKAFRVFEFLGEGWL